MTSTGPAANLVLLAAPSVAGQGNKLKGCVLSNSNSAPICLTVAGQYTNDATFQICASSFSSYALGGGYGGNDYGQAAGGLTALFGEDLVSSGTWKATVSANSSAQSGVLLSCSYIALPLR